MQYDLLRLVLAQRDQPDFLSRRGPEGQPLNREAWLRSVFGESIEFLHYKKPFHFVPETRGEGIFVVGRVGREYHAVENEPPEEGLTEVIHDAWIAAAVILDPTSHDDGQKIACEVNGRVGQPLPIFESLVGHINSRIPREPYVIEVNPVVDPETFWEFERENRGEITSIEFDLLVPNMFGTRSDLDRELKELKDHEKVRKAQLRLENDEGLKLDTDRTRQTVDYTLEGGGGIIAKAKRKRKTFRSKRKGKRITIEKPLLPATEAQETFMSKVGRAITRVFGV